MRKHYTLSDGGCIMFGNKDFVVKVFNRFGDCRNTILVFDSHIEFMDYCEEKYHKRSYYDCHFHCDAIINGKFNLYKYDCAKREDYKEIKTKFNGKYTIYIRCCIYEYPTIAIVKDE